MNGIIFLKTKSLAVVEDFYVSQVGMDIWLEQADCKIFRKGNLLLGFCERAKPDKDFGIITFYCPTREDVDDLYTKFESVADAPPKVNEKYDIYHFFMKDPEGRVVEFQQFLGPVEDIFPLRIIGS